MDGLDGSLTVVTVHVILAGVIIGLLTSFMNKILLPAHGGDGPSCAEPRDASLSRSVRYLKRNVRKRMK